MNENKWIEFKKIPESVGKCGIFEINNVCYVVANVGISTINKDFYKFPSDKCVWFSTSCRVGNNILVIRTNVNYIESKLFNTISKRWSDVNIETKRDSFDVVHYLNKVWIVGGLGPDDYLNFKTFNTIQIYDPINKNTYLSQVRMIQERKGHKVIVYNDKLFVFSGINRYDIPVNTVEMYSPETNKFVIMAPMKVARFCFACCRVGNLVYVIGGTIKGFKSTNTVEVYNLDTDTWADGINSPIGSHALIACAVKNEL